MKGMILWNTFLYITALKFFIILLLIYLHNYFHSVTITTTDSIIIQLKNNLHQSHTSEISTTGDVPKFVSETKHTNVGIITSGIMYLCFFVQYSLQ
jgi:hypothetical protein